MGSLVVTPPAAAACARRVSADLGVCDHIYKPNLRYAVYIGRSHGRPILFSPPNIIVSAATKIVERDHGCTVKCKLLFGLSEIDGGMQTECCEPAEARRSWKRRGASWSSFDCKSMGSNPQTSAMFPRRLILGEWPSGQRR